MWFSKKKVMFQITEFFVPALLDLYKYLVYCSAYLYRDFFLDWKGY